LGFRNSSVLQKDLASLIHPEKVDYTLIHLNKLRKNELEEFQGEMEVLCENGSYLHTITRVARISNLGKSDFLLAQIVDISQLKKSEDRLKEKNLELEKANAELDKFVYSAAHDLRAPLTSVLGLINLVKSENGTDLKKYIDLIEKSIIKLDYFIKDVIDYSRNSRLGISAQAIDIKALIEKTFEYHNFIEGGATIRKQILIEGNEEFYCDQGRIEIILNNIISNAIKYYDPKKEDSFIKVCAIVERHGLSLEISDNGIGIPPENLDKIFNIFYRGHEQSKGSGLGLYIVKETVEKINGVILVESELNKGTSFRIRIPNAVLEDA
jgi:PAS domain S-box-containing protein